MRTNKTMLGKLLRWSGTTLIALFLGISLVLAAPRGALLKPTGNVTINGSRVTVATVLFPGDKVQTAEKSVADISWVGNMVVLGSNTDVTYGNGELEMGCGDALINSTSGHVKVMSKSYSAQPTDGAPAKFELFQGGGKLRTVVYKGSLSVTAPQKSPTALSAGKSMVVAGLTGCATLTAMSAPTAAAAAAAGAGSAAAAATPSRALTAPQPEASPSAP